ncbi:hypothetical protein M446_1156 [Methylobacterium sp. 4-46]|uniref:hypothetical protein n=1 Tax=unclassified Methylobacterium TaxID=2615210 RepID=UPI000165C889|nr:MULTISPECIES: hypothetical protein [Methylobacterium]ACA15682.1 hypothetical protein M446_1156 [Methylobacterium sp. 4-46]WFT81394.1 hypothetical protein QA634_05750 [Methylobacterium nodulans]
MTLNECSDVQVLREIADVLGCALQRIEYSTGAVADALDEHADSLDPAGHTIAGLLKEQRVDARSALHLAVSLLRGEASAEAVRH